MVREEIAHRQDEFRAALLRGDAAVLDAMVAEGCRITGPKGFFIGRDEWISTHQDSDYQQVRLESREAESAVYGDTAIRWEVQDSRCVYKGETIDGRFRVTQVWVYDRDRWQLAALQYTALPA